MLERLVMKNAAQRTSQRVKWTSGARDLINSFDIFVRGFEHHEYARKTSFDKSYPPH